MKSPELTATVIIPTSIDRGPALALAVRSVLRQTVPDLEVFIIGDGAHALTADTARKLERSDPRVRFFGHPKHARRGEPYRDAALREARGRIVCYLTDRDLYLPHHVQTMADGLRDADLVHNVCLKVREEGGFGSYLQFDLGHPFDRRDYLNGNAIGGVPLSTMAHTMAAYRRLPEGWTQTPPGVATDRYFAAKFVRHPAMRCRHLPIHTVIYFKRGDHPGWTTAQRLPELQTWSRRIEDPTELDKIRQEAFAAMVDRINTNRRRLGALVAFRGMPWYLWLSRLPGLSRLARDL